MRKASTSCPCTGERLPQGSVARQGWDAIVCIPGLSSMASLRHSLRFGSPDLRTSESLFHVEGLCERSETIP